MPVDSKIFENHAEKTLQDLFEQIDDTLGDIIDVDIEGGVLLIELESGGQYVINKQTPNREIWLSSPMSGARHFNFDEAQGAWVDTRAGEKLYDLLSNEMAQASGRSFTLHDEGLRDAQ